MFDLQALAFATETTRVSAFKMSRDTSNRIFPESGVKTPFHTLSHHSQKPALIAEFATLNRYHVSLLPYFLQKLRDTPDGGGNLLDHSLILYGSPMGDSNAHNHRRLPLLLAGHAGGQLRGNLHCVCPTATPQANCLLTILHKLDVDIASVGTAPASWRFNAGSDESKSAAALAPLQHKQPHALAARHEHAVKRLPAACYRSILPARQTDPRTSVLQAQVLRPSR